MSDVEQLARTLHQVVEQLSGPAPFYSPADLATRLRVHRRTILRWLEAGHFPQAVRFSGAGAAGDWRIPQEDVVAFLATRRVFTEDHRLEAVTRG